MPSRFWSIGEMSRAMPRTKFAGTPGQPTWSPIWIVSVASQPEMSAASVTCNWSFVVPCAGSHFTHAGSGVVFDVFQIRA